MTGPRLYRPCGVNIQADGRLLTRSRPTAGRLGRRRRPYSVRLSDPTEASAEVICQLIARSVVMFAIDGSGSVRDQDPGDGLEQELRQLPAGSVHVMLVVPSGDCCGQETAWCSLPWGSFARLGNLCDHKRLAWESARSSPAALASGGRNRTLDRGREKLSHCSTVIVFHARHYERLM